MALPASAINTAGNSNFGVRGTVPNMEGELTSDDAPANKAQLVVSYGPTLLEENLARALPPRPTQGCC